MFTKSMKISNGVGNKRLIYILWLVILGLMISARQTYAEPTIEELLEKKIANDTKINTLQAEAINTWEIESKNFTRVHYSKIYKDGDEKYRSEVYADNEYSQLIQTQIVNGNTTVLIDHTGQIYQMDMEEETPSGEELIGTDIDKFLEYYDVSIDYSKSDEAKQIYCLQIVPKDNSSMYEVISKQEVYIDYTKGVSPKIVSYNEQNEQAMTVEYEDLELINNIYFHKTKKITVITSNGTEVINQINYNNVKLNEYITPEKFAIPEAEE